MAAAAYLAHMREVAIPDYRSTLGNLGAWCLHRAEGDVVHFQMLSFWPDLAAIRTPRWEEDPEVAKYYDFDRDFLIELEPHVTHYEVDEG